MGIVLTAHCKCVIWLVHNFDVEKNPSCIRKKKFKKLKKNSQDLRWNMIFI